MKKQKILLIISILFISNLFTSITQAAINTDTASADITDIELNDDYYEATIKYKLPNNDKELLVSSENIKDINSEDLEKELGKKNISINEKEKYIEINLKDNIKKGQFQIKVLKSDYTILSVNDKKKHNLITKELTVDTDKQTGQESTDTNNSIETSDNDSTNNENDESTEAKENSEEEIEDPDEKTVQHDEPGEEWQQTKNFRLSQGPTLEHNDGNITVPFLYFGDINFVRMHMTIAKAYEKNPKGDGRIDSITAPNFCMVTAPKGTDLHTDGNFVNDHTHMYTHNFGDGQASDGKSGSDGTFVTTDIHNTELSATDKKHFPSMSGPDIAGADSSMLTIPKLYFRLDPKTGFEEQKLVFFQQHVKKGRTYKIEVSIVQRFDFYGEVFTDINYKNVGNKEFDDFIGFAFHDLTLTKDFAQIKDKKGVNIGDYAPMRSLGNGRGFYMQSDNAESRINFHMNGNNSPWAWATRSITKSYEEFKGYTNAGGGLSFLFGSILQAKFTGNPWKHSVNYQYSDGRYKPGSVPERLFNAFYYDEDPGDKGFDPGAGKRLGKLHYKHPKDKPEYISESTPLWDSGVTMHTEHQTLEVGDSVKLSYSRSVDLNRKNFAPVNNMDQRGTNDDPDIVAHGTHKYDLTGSWYDFDSNDVELFVSLDNDKFEAAEKVNSYSQKDEEKVAGVPHEWNASIDLTDKLLGKHTAYVWFKDKEGNISLISTSTFYIPAESTNAPQISIITPESAEDNPYIPSEPHFNISGIWSDKDSRTIKNIRYSVDNGTDKTIASDIKNPSKGKNQNWNIKDFNTNDIEDIKIHKLTVKILDNDGNEGSAILYFRKAPGNVEIVAPENIDFGQQLMVGEKSPHLHPNFDEKVEVNDYRQENAKPLDLFLSMSEFESIDYDDLKISHAVYLDENLQSDELFIGKTNDPNDGQKMTSTDFTQKIKDRICVVFNYDEHVKPGTFQGQWVWEARDVP
ncbi:hypothetical protein [Companilactobacillus sp. HBUAS59699]|uniref:hypothetical protein n=1 Tax=Companilactobacillus sp. HBUAS59699 TaxID=3109358 RepID=UPI002FF42CEF